jgi:hypothetical protein
MIEPGRKRPGLLLGYPRLIFAENSFDIDAQCHTDKATPTELFS